MVDDGNRVSLGNRVNRGRRGNLAAVFGAEGESGPLVELDHIGFSYHDPYGSGAGSRETDAVLHDFSMTIRRGECVALLGPNGVGKTTIMRIINALEFPDAGTYRFCGTAVTRARVEERDGLFAKALHQRIGFVFQNSDTQLFCPSVAEEIAFGPMQMGLDDAEVRARVDDMIALFGLERLRDRAPYRHRFVLVFRSYLGDELCKLHVCFCRLCQLLIHLDAFLGKCFVAFLTGVSSLLLPIVGSLNTSVLLPLLHPFVFVQLACVVSRLY